MLLVISFFTLASLLAGVNGDELPIALEGPTPDIAPFSKSPAILATARRWSDDILL